MPNRIKDRTGNRFNDIEVLKIYEGEPVYKTVKQNKNGVMWLCMCTCGNLMAISSQYISNGNISNCGNCNYPDIVLDGEDAILPLSGGSVVVDINDADVLSSRSWKLDTNNYAVSWEPSLRRYIRLHRLLLNAPINMFIDHIDGDPLNNRRSNIRVVTRRQNCLNTKCIKNTATGVKGVTVCGGRYVSRITVDGECIYLGTYSTLDDAADARNAAEIKHFGEYSRLNLK